MDQMYPIAENVLHDQSGREYIINRIRFYQSKIIETNRLIDLIINTNNCLCTSKKNKKYLNTHKDNLNVYKSVILDYNKILDKV
tara:strand:- start:233 stop:484 length:252 start_codon:yes stop_codon:yes gene_type:complete